MEWSASYTRYCTSTQIRKFKSKRSKSVSFIKTESYFQKIRRSKELCDDKLKSVKRYSKIKLAYKIQNPRGEYFSKYQSWAIWKKITLTFCSSI